MLIEFGALWNKTTQPDGKEYFTGNIGRARIVILPNRYKRDESHPDWILFVTEPRKKMPENDGK